MDFLKKRFPKKIRFLNEIFFRPEYTLEIHSLKNFFSAALQRAVHIDVFLPPGHFCGETKAYPTLFLNDGQDAPALGPAETLERLWAQGKLPPVMVAAIHANGNCMQEYGAAGRPDYKGRGSKGKSDAGFFAVGIWEDLEHVLH